ncbi:sigma 54-interacting response regulator [Dyadobacter pollutisoli]|uniref:Sigma 54-interacting response regulator n=1 Tax=Dyadobacter pollutisoli TaxID=2910158 RepID=A0A9E8SS14_9BACT|nr:sigma 54-interacting response regulator [Dyadobacter pollutisoli]WAC14822.1 sigma 54-interacting response regulator [Dyadobacter pollutisoli]
MKKKILIVEDQFIEANHLRIMLERAGYEVSGIARSVEQAEEQVAKEAPALVLLDIFLTGTRTGIELAEQLREANIPFIYLSANSNEEILNAAKATHPNGFLVKPFREKDLLVALQIAEYHHENGLEAKLRKEAIFQKQLTAITQEKLAREQTLLKIAQVLQPLFPFDMMAVGYVGELPHVTHVLHFLRIGFNEYQVIDAQGLRVVSNLKLEEFNTLQSKMTPAVDVEIHTGAAFKKLAAEPSVRKLIATTFGMNSYLGFPLQTVHQVHGLPFLAFYSRRPDAYNEEHKALCYRMMPLLSQTLQHLVKSEKPAAFEQDRNVSPTTYSTNNQVNTFEGIIGQSHLLLNVFDLISQVAPVDTSVLITGESGTGKERVADTIHALSMRKTQPLIKVNCAALPTNLIESELFGHEKGAFTGAFEKRTGRFEQANNGTIFLDEIGDMPLETQVKLLRVLQQKEIERLGGKAPVKVDIRIIAATNRNLEKEVAEGRFRLDLYYRLNVFPIQMPSLSDRKEDIPLLVDHFLQYYGRKTGKKITGVSEKGLRALALYDWPGNIRELENVIERSVLLAKGTLIDQIILPTNSVAKVSGKSEEARLKTIFENERDHIIAVLKKCNGRIRGSQGAAEILDIPPSTLGSKMKKLGIKRDFGY